ncbi:EamA family transporter RarD [Cellulomonas edaphi]|uniref:EamA family transporter RarD n=1 Tax=Cellulomonas edaphi TaxID=3053468 RepID=A0ABT7S995_9CELL|nr:EamA family transporter RarD [Cellulomons edaphi]MDM7832202.1 EamA family transporter RarD [Cellulomons edaphi]
MPSTTTRSGLVAGIGAYALWGVLPLYFPLLQPAGAVEIVAHRVVWSLLFCLLLLRVTRTWQPFVETLRHRRTLTLLALAAVLLAVNWIVFVVGILSDRVVDAALGYFINPLVTVGLAVVVLRERVRPVQWVALAFGAAAVVVITVGYGRLPWIALTLAFSFGFYGLIKNRVGRSVGAVPGLATETLVLTPLALGYLLVLQAQGTASFAAHGGWHAVALVSAGVVTAVPLLLFGSAARRLPLSVVGMLQYIAPVLQFLIGVVVLDEEMEPARWWGFALVWVALAILSVDGLRHSRAEALVRRSAGQLPTSESASA